LIQATKEDNFLNELLTCASYHLLVLLFKILNLGFRLYRHCPNIQKITVGSSLQCHDASTSTNATNTRKTIQLPLKVKKFASIFSTTDVPTPIVVSFIQIYLVVEQSLKTYHQTMQLHPNLRRQNHGI